MNALTTFSYAGSKISFATESGVRVNATQMAKPFGKTPKDWLRTEAAKEFISTLSAVRQICLTALVLKKQGGNGEQGTWMHEDVALEFARWLSPTFAIWCNDRIKELLTAPKQPTEAEVLPPPIENQQVTQSLVEYVDGKAVTTSRKLAHALGRKHDSILGTIKANLHTRAFKYGNFITRPYGAGPAHGYEFLITRRGLEALASVMRYNARDKIAETYAGAWGAPSQKLLPLPAPAPTPVPDPQAGEDESEEEDEITYTPEQQKYIDWLESYNDDLCDRMRKAKATMRMYTEMYESERRARKRQSDMSGYWHDLYEDLMLRILNLNDTEEMMKAHNAFKKRISNR